MKTLVISTSPVYHFAVTDLQGDTIVRPIFWLLASLKRLNQFARFLFKSVKSNFLFTYFLIHARNHINELGLSKVNRVHTVLEKSLKSEGP